MNDKIPVIIEIPTNGIMKTFRGLFEVPKFEVEKIEIPYMSVSTYSAGRSKWGNAKLMFYDCNTFDAFSWISDWIREHNDSATTRLGYTISTKKNIVITKINNFNENFEYDKLCWTLIGAQIINFNTNLMYDFNQSEFWKIIYNNITRKVLFEKINNPTLQILIEIELSLDRFIANEANP
jgi:hypothetical protein